MWLNVHGDEFVWDEFVGDELFGDESSRIRYFFHWPSHTIHKTAKIFLMNFMRKSLPIYKTVEKLLQLRNKL